MLEGLVEEPISGKLLKESQRISRGAAWRTLLGNLGEGFLAFLQGFENCVGNFIAACRMKS
jgi:hypothetical protein